MSDLVERLHHVADTAHNDDRWTDRRDAREAADEIERLQAALRPFAKMASMYDNPPNDLPDAATLGLFVTPEEGRATVGDLRRARVALLSSKWMACPTCHGSGELEPGIGCPDCNEIGYVYPPAISGKGETAT